MVKAAAYGMSRFMLFESLSLSFLVSFSRQELTLKAYFIPFYNNR